MAGKNTLFRILIGALLLQSCTEAPLIENPTTATFNSPISMVLIPGSTLAVVANANVFLDQTSGSLFAIDLNTNLIEADTLVEIPNFAGRISVDPAMNRLYVPVRSNGTLLVFDYLVPGTGKAIDLNLVDEIDLDDNPFDSYVAVGTDLGDVVYVSNILSGSISVVPEISLIPPDLDLEINDQQGLPLFSAKNAELRSSLPGQGASNMAVTPDGKLLYIASTLSNDVYVLSTQTHQVEAMLDLSRYSSAVGIRNIVFDSSNRAYFAIRGMKGVLVLDVSPVVENGVPFEVVDTNYLNGFLSGIGPEGLFLSPDEQHLFVSDIFDNEVVMINTVTGVIEARTKVGKAPGDLVFDPSSNLIYVLNFISDEQGGPGTISIIDLTTGANVGEIP